MNNELIKDAIEDIKNEIEHLAFRPYEGRDTLDRAEVLEIIDKHISGKAK